MASFVKNLKQVYNGLFLSGKKIQSSAKFIDFFVHDILDYTIMNQVDKNFQQIIEVFDLLESVNQIIVILTDKSQMKNIRIRTLY